jgi:hypothetical protein
MTKICSPLAWLLVVDDHVLTHGKRGRAMLQREPHLEVTGEAEERLGVVISVLFLRSHSS